jgi:hypothetical protein
MPSAMATTGSRWLAANTAWCKPYSKCRNSTWGETEAGRQHSISLEKAPSFAHSDPLSPILPGLAARRPRGS